VGGTPSARRTAQSRANFSDGCFGNRAERPDGVVLVVGDLVLHVRGRGLLSVHGSIHGSLPAPFPWPNQTPTSAGTRSWFHTRLPSRACLTANPLRSGHDSRAKWRWPAPGYQPSGLCETLIPHGAANPIAGGPFRLPARAMARSNSQTCLHSRAGAGQGDMPKSSAHHTARQSVRTSPRGKLQAAAARRRGSTCCITPTGFLLGRMLSPSRRKRTVPTSEPSRQPSSGPTEGLARNFAISVLSRRASRHRPPRPARTLRRPPRRAGGTVARCPIGSERLPPSEERPR
jgi:hypothetical protein